MISGHSLGGAVVEWFAMDGAVRKILRDAKVKGHIFGQAAPAPFTPDLIKYYQCLQVEDNYTLTVLN